MNSSDQATQTAIKLIAVVAVIAALHSAQEVLIPLALAILLTFLLVPIVDRLQRWGVNRAISVGVAVSLAVAVIGSIGYVVVDQFASLVGELPAYRRQLRENIGELTGALRGGMGETATAMKQLTREIERASPAVPPEIQRIPKVQVVEPPPNTFESLSNFVGPLLQPLATAALVLVFVIFMLLRFTDLRDRLIRLLGSGNVRVTTEALNDAASGVSRYLLAQTIVNGGQGLLVALGLSLIGLPNALLWGALTLVLRFIPYVGPWVAASVPIALSFAVFDNWTYPLLTIGLFITLESISNMIVEPWLYGTHTGVSPVALLVAAAFWAWLWGPIGLFLAIPLTVCLVVMGKYIPHLEFLHVMLSDEPVFEPHEQLYQRLLAGNRDQAEALLAEALRTQSPRKVCDEIVVPAVRLAERDYDRGNLDETQRGVVREVIDQWTKRLSEAKAPTGPMKRLAECAARVNAWSS